MIAGPEHGADDGAAVTGRFRAEPASNALRWVEETVGARVVAVAAMRGGSSAAMHIVTVVDIENQATQVVLRRYLREEHRADQPSPAAMEAQSLTLLAPSTIPTPELLAVDATFQHADAPAVIMSYLVGRPRWDAANRQAWCHDLAALAASIHAIALPAPGTARDYAPYPQRSYQPPGWADDRRVWERAVDIFHGPPPERRSFIHRDFHPGNLLWRRQHLAGVVDWESARIGPPDVHIGHCRLNFLYQTPELAEQLAVAWRDVTATIYHPWADVAAIIGVLDGLGRHPPPAAARAALESTLAWASPNSAHGRTRDRPGQPTHPLPRRATIPTDTSLGRISPDPTEPNCPLNRQLCAESDGEQLDAKPDMLRG